MVFSPEALEATCQRLLGYGLEAVGDHAEASLRPVTAADAGLGSVFLHSTTPELKTFDGDLDALVHGTRGGDFTTYKEARSVYLAAPGDVVVGRTRSWRSAVAAIGADGIDLESNDHYYLSHALLHLATAHRDGSGSPMDRLVSLVRESPRLFRLYAFEVEMQVFLLWLARQSGRESLIVEANRPAVASAWNRKSVLHPTVERALSMPGPTVDDDGLGRLVRESQESELVRRLGIELPTIPGYTLERSGRSTDEFIEQLHRAAGLLRTRYGLEAGCLKASESGDGARIVPGIDLDDQARLSTLGREAARYGDDYVLEAHVTYGRAEIAGAVLPLALSAHVRGGRVAPKATAQFMEGTSWKGNVLLDGNSLDLFGVAAEHYRRLRRFVQDFHGAFERRGGGLVLAGVDFAIGSVGGRFGDTTLLGVQDLNVSFTGAECLRAFLDKGSERDGGGGGYGVTRILTPTPAADHEAFERVTRRFDVGGVRADTMASVPGRWAMVGISGEDPRDAIENLGRLLEALRAAGLVAGS